MLLYNFSPPLGKILKLILQFGQPKPPLFVVENINFHCRGTLILRIYSNSNFTKLKNSFVVKMQNEKNNLKQYRYNTRILAIFIEMIGGVDMSAHMFAHADVKMRYETTKRIVPILAYFFQPKRSILHQFQ